MLHSVTEKIYKVDGSNLWLTFDEAGLPRGVFVSQALAERDIESLLSELRGEPSTPQVRRMLDITTAHVSETTAAMLNSWAELGPYPDAPVVYGKGEYGWLVYVPSELPAREDKPLYPDDLWAVVEAASRLGCDWIMFDRDGVEFDGLETFDW